MTRKYNPNVDYPASMDFARYPSSDTKPIRKWMFREGKYEGQKIYDVVRKDPEYIVGLLNHLKDGNLCPGLSNAINELIDGYIGEVCIDEITEKSLGPYFQKGELVGKTVDEVLESQDGIYVFNLLVYLETTGKHPKVLEKLKPVVDKMWDRVEAKAEEEQARFFNDK